MSEKAYNTMKTAGGWSIAAGIVLIVVGLACGIMMIVNGGRLLKNKKNILM